MRDLTIKSIIKLKRKNRGVKNRVVLDRSGLSKVLVCKSLKTKVKST